ncbi:unnamed protein product [Bathycoccus prasinos]
MLRASSSSAAFTSTSTSQPSLNHHHRMPESPSKHKQNRTMSKSTGGLFAMSSMSSFCLKTLLPLLALVYLLLLAEEFPTFNTASVVSNTNAGYSGERNILCDVGVPEFIVFVDAGSTGCRAHTFRVNYSADEDEGEEEMTLSKNDDKTQRLFSLTTVGKKVKSLHPLASLSGKSEKDIETALLPMLEGAMRKIEAIEEKEKTNGKRKRRRRSPITTSFGKGEQSEGKSRVPLYVWATAGMRILTEKEQKELWRSVASVARKATPRFAIGREEEHFKTIDGEDEGFYAWLAANYLVGVDVTSIGADVDGFGGLTEEERNRLFREMNNARKPLEESVGAIDVGGGSAQVVTLSASGFMRKTKKITSMEQLRKAVRVKSYLGYGANHMEKRWREALAERGEKRNPCGFIGYEAKTSLNAILIGSGEYEKCALGLKKQIQKMLAEDGNGDMRLPKASLSEDVGQTKKFLGMSLLYHVTHFISVVMPSSLVTFPKPTLLEIADAGKSLCATTWSVVSSDFDGKDPNTPSDRLNGRCFDVALLDALLSIDEKSNTVGFGFPKYSTGVSSDDSSNGLRMIEYAEDVNGSEVEWTLGAAISEIHPAAKAQASGPGGDAAEFEQTCDIRSSFATVTGVFKKMLAIVFVAIGLFSLYSARAVSNLSSSGNSFSSSASLSSQV